MHTKKNRKKKLIIIVPCYNEEENISLFYDAVKKISKKTSLNELCIIILFINDGSTDNTLKILKEMGKQFNDVKYISFSRNFGKEAAIFAGMENSDSDYVAIMDADLQDPPVLLEEMYQSIKNNLYDCIATRRRTRKKDLFLRSFFTKQFYKLFNIISETEIADGTRDFRFMTRQMVVAILSLKEKNRFSKGLFNWVGFKVKWITYENADRVKGRTKWTFWSLFTYSVNAIIAFSEVPLALVSILGVILSLIAFLVIATIISKKLIWDYTIAGWPLIAAIVSLIGGLQLFCLGIIGQYLGKTYRETQKRPLYIIKESNLSKDI